MLLSKGGRLVQADFIGAERDSKRDEKMRAKLHAAWLEQQDTARVEALLHGVRNGFRKKRSALDDEASSAPLQQAVWCLLCNLASGDRTTGRTCEAHHGQVLCRKVVQPMSNMHGNIC